MDYEVFFESINDYNIIQLAHWIRKFRSAVVLSDGDRGNNNYSRFNMSFTPFYQQYRDYWDSHEAKFKSKDFRLALKLSVLPKASYVLITSDGIETDVTTEMEELQLYNMQSSPLVAKTINREEERAKQYSKLINEFVHTGERKPLHTIINSLALETCIYKINILEKEEHLKTKSYFEIIYSIKRGKVKQHPVKLIPNKGKTLSDYLVEDIRKNQINKNVFYSFVNNYDVNRRYEKQFFYNVGFYIGLDASEMERVLKNEGYTIECSLRNDDKIVYDCFYYYLSQEYANALLINGGYTTLNMR